MKSLYLHCGTHKTGSTAIQVFLGEHESALKEIGVLVPKTGRINASVGAHHNLAWALSGDIRFDPELGATVDLLNELAATPHAAVVLSSEDFGCLSAEPEKLRPFVQTLHSAGYTINWIVYLRDKKEYAISIFREMLTIYSDLSPDDYVRAIIETNSYCKGFPHPCVVDFDYPRLLNHYGRVVGECGTVITRRYCSDVVGDFIEQIGLPRDAFDTSTRANVAGSKHVSGVDRVATLLNGRLMDDWSILDGSGVGCPRAKERALAWFAPAFGAVPERLTDTTAWHGHLPFAMCVMTEENPRVFVELGTHRGDSYSAFCQAVVRFGLKTRCYAVDTWKGDRHAGEYDNHVYDELKSFHDRRYANFSTLLCKTFDQALADFVDGSIDLLHIDGLHTYEEVRHDFEMWLPKMSDRGVVLFHDTVVTAMDFGVWRFWSELQTQYPSFEFFHSHGLGILAVGKELDPALRKLCESNSRQAAYVRWVFREQAALINAEKVLVQSGAGAILATERSDHGGGISYREWCNIFGLHESDGQVMAERMILGWRHQPVIHLIAVLRRGEGASMAETLDSLSTQLYSGWGLTVLAEEPCPDPLFTQIPNVEWRESKGDSAAALSAIVGETESDWVGLLRPGDRLAQNALFACADHIQIADGARLFYTDWDRLDEAGNRCDARFERDADLDWFRTGECLRGLWLIRRDALIELGGFADRGMEEARDLALRLFEHFGSEAFGHVDEVLCHRPASSRTAGEGADTGSHRAVLATHLQRVGEPGEIVEGLAPGTLRVRYPVRGEPPVSLIVDTTDDLRVFEQFVETLRAVTQYPKLELVVVDCGSRDEDTHEYFDALRAVGAVVVSAREGAGRAEAWNTGARAARGEYLIFADRRAGFVQKDWVEILLGHAQREGVGIVAPRIVGADSALVHSALILGFDGPAKDAFQGLSAEDPGYGGRALTEQGCSAVGPACLLVSRACFDEAGGFDAERFSSDWFSVDFCLRAEAAGRRTVWTPYALLGWQAPEPARPTGDVGQEAALYERWLPRLVCDPFYHRDMSLSGTAFRPRSESTARWNPVFHDRPRILGVPADTFGCGEYRILAPLNALDDAARAQCGVLAPQEGAPRMPSVTELARLAPDTLLLQSALDDVHLEALRRCRRFNRAFRVFDMEDLKTAVPEKNSRRKFLFRDIKARTRKALGLCDRLLVTTEPLAEAHRGLIDDIRVVPIYLAGGRWGNLAVTRNEGGRPRVGWAGGQQHEGDLEILLPVVEATAREVDWVFFGMCPDALRPYVREVHDLVPFAEYPARLSALALDLAVAPLEDHPFNVAKSNLRLLEYGVLGWPVVCTDIEPYRAAPVMRVPNDPVRWIEAIRERAHDLDAARAEGARLRDWVFGGWMLEDHLDEWLESLSPDEGTGVVVVGRA